MDSTYVKKDQITILLLSWRDIRSPKSGGAKFSLMKC